MPSERRPTAVLADASNAQSLARSSARKRAPQSVEKSAKSDGVHSGENDTTRVADGDAANVNVFASIDDVVKEINDMGARVEGERARDDDGDA